MDQWYNPVIVGIISGLLGLGNELESVDHKDVQNDCCKVTTALLDNAPTGICYLHKRLNTFM